MYPAEIEFRGATYLGRKAADQGFIVWDAGTYSIVEPDQIRISTATDEIVPYHGTLAGDHLTFVDRDGCTFSYRRIA